MLPILVFALFVLLIDLYVYKGLKVLFDKPSNPVITLFFRTIYWLIPSMLLGSVILVVYLRPVGTDPRIFNGHFYIVAFTLMFYLPKMVFAVFHLLDDFMLIATRIASHIRGYLERKHIPFGEKNGSSLS